MKRTLNILTISLLFSISSNCASISESALSDTSESENSRNSNSEGAEASTDLDDEGVIIDLAHDVELFRAREAMERNFIERIRAMVRADANLDAGNDTLEGELKKIEASIADKTQLDAEIEKSKSLTDDKANLINKLANQKIAISALEAAQKDLSAENTRLTDDLNREKNLHGHTKENLRIACHKAVKSVERFCTILHALLRANTPVQDMKKIVTAAKQSYDERYGKNDDEKS